MYAIAVAIAFVGALVLGMPLGSLALLAIVVACPLMMFFMMRGMHGGHGGGGDQHTDQSDPLRKHDHHQHLGGRP